MVGSDHEDPSVVAETLGQEISSLNQEIIEGRISAINEAKEFIHNGDLNTDEELALITGVINTLDIVIERNRHMSISGEVSLQSRCWQLVGDGLTLLCPHSRGPPPIDLLSESRSNTGHIFTKIINICLNLLPPEPIFDRTPIGAWRVIEEVAFYAPRSIACEGVPAVEAAKTLILLLENNASEKDSYDVLRNKHISFVGVSLECVDRVLCSLISADPSLVEEIPNSKSFVQIGKQCGLMSAWGFDAAYHAILLSRGESKRIFSGGPNDSYLQFLGVLPTPNIIRSDMCRIIIRLDPQFHPVLNPNEQMVHQERVNLLEDYAQYLIDEFGCTINVGSLTAGNASTITSDEYLSWLDNALTQYDDKLLFRAACSELGTFRAIPVDTVLSLDETLRQNPLMEEIKNVNGGLFSIIRDSKTSKAETKIALDRLLTHIFENDDEMTDGYVFSIIGAILPGSNFTKDTILDNIYNHIVNSNVDSTGFSVEFLKFVWEFDRQHYVVDLFESIDVSLENKSEFDSEYRKAVTILTNIFCDDPDIFDDSEHQLYIHHCLRSLDHLGQGPPSITPETLNQICKYIASNDLVSENQYEQAILSVCSYLRRNPSAPLLWTSLQNLLRHQSGHSIAVEESVLNLLQETDLTGFPPWKLLGLLQTCDFIKRGHVIETLSQHLPSAGRVSPFGFSTYMGHLGYYYSAEGLLLSTVMDWDETSPELGVRILQHHTATLKNYLEGRVYQIDGELEDIIHLVDTLPKHIFQVETNLLAELIECCTKLMQHSRFSVSVKVRTMAVLNALPQPAPVPKESMS